MPFVKNIIGLDHLINSEKCFIPNCDRAYPLGTRTNIGIITFPRNAGRGWNVYSDGKTEIASGIMERSKMTVRRHYNPQNLKTKELQNAFADTMLYDDIVNIIADYVIPQDPEYFTYSKATEYNNSMLREKDNLEQKDEIIMNCNLIVVSPKMVKTWSPYQGLHCFYGGPKQTVAMIKTKKEMMTLEKMNEFDVVVISRLRLKEIYQCEYDRKARKWKYLNIVWNRVFIDAFDKLHNNTKEFCPPLKSDFLWILCRDLDKLKINTFENSKSFIHRTLYDLSTYQIQYSFEENLDFINYDQSTTRFAV